MSRSMRLLLLQRSFSDHIRSSTSKALDMLSKTARESRLSGEWRRQWLTQQVHACRNLCSSCTCLFASVWSCARSVPEFPPSTWSFRFLNKVHNRMGKLHCHGLREKTGYSAGLLYGEQCFSQTDQWTAVNGDAAAQGIRRWLVQIFLCPFFKMLILCFTWQQVSLWWWVCMCVDFEIAVLAFSLLPASCLKTRFCPCITNELVVHMQDWVQQNRLPTPWLACF